MIKGMIALDYITGIVNATYKDGNKIDGHLPARMEVGEPCLSSVQSN